MKTMNDLHSYKNAQIERLQARVLELEVDKTQLCTWLFEVCDEDCPKEYREVVREEMNKMY